MTLPQPFDRYLMGHLASEHAVPASALRRAIAIDSDCSPFEVHLTPIKQCGPSVLYRVSLPCRARLTQATDIWPLGRLSLIDDPKERQRVESVTSSLWPLISRPSACTSVTTVRLGDPVLYAFQLKADERKARVFSSGAIGNMRNPQENSGFSFSWARDWLVTTLESGGWRVVQSAAPPTYDDVDWAMGQ